MNQIIHTFAFAYYTRHHEPSWQLSLSCLDEYVHRAFAIFLACCATSIIFLNVSIELIRVALADLEEQASASL